MSIENKVVVIAGGGGGMGRAAAMLLAERGAKLLVAGRNRAELDEVVAAIGAAGGTALAHACDVTRREDAQAMVDAAKLAFGRVDVLVNAAGIAPIARLDALSIDDWDAMIDVNLRGFLHCVAAALPVFREQEDGHVVTIVSVAGLLPSSPMGVYAATKNAVRTLSEILRQESGPNLRVTEVSPGMVATGFTASIRDEATRGAIEATAKDIAIPADAIARAIAFAIEQPRDVNVSSLVIYPTAQG